MVVRGTEENPHTLSSEDEEDGEGLEGHPILLSDDEGTYRDDGLSTEVIEIAPKRFPFRHSRKHKMHPSNCDLKSTCSICLGLLGEPGVTVVVTGCNHCYHLGCLKNQYRHQPDDFTCATCRKELDPIVLTLSTCWYTVPNDADEAGPAYP